MDGIDLSQFEPGDADYTISEEDHFRLWRAHDAVALLAALNNDTATKAGISADGTAAVADFIREELLDVCMHAQRIRASLDPEAPVRAADLI